MDVQPWSQTRLVDLSGTPDHISRAEQLISDVLAEAHAGSFGTIPNWKYNAPQPSVEQFQMQIANNKKSFCSKAAWLRVRFATTSLPLVQRLRITADGLTD
ncbi:hypothetical protein ZWY2020_003754 [Hordeum vulgare]|nr:hypothetical protein ZWY2020_003754 [Hordeum vulgare]